MFKCKKCHNKWEIETRQKFQYCPICGSHQRPLRLEYPPISELDISTRLRHILKMLIRHSKAESLDDILKQSDTELLKCKGIGKTTLRELRTLSI